jgi:hypothetical protein
MSGQNPWADITPGQDGESVNSRRADPGHPLEFFWARDNAGRYLFLFRCSSNVATDLRVPNFAGIEIFLENLSSGGGLVRLVLLDGEQIDIFRTICRDLMRATERVSVANAEQAVTLILTRLRRWQDLLKISGQRGLSKQAQLGLFGELVFLRDLFMKNLPVHEAVAAWRGPMGAEQDFGYTDWLFEIKSQLTTSDQALIISSLSQLDTGSGNIILCHQTFSVGSEHDAGVVTLRSLVANLRSTIRDSDPLAGDLFQTALLEAGYSDKDEYGELHYMGLVRCMFRVEDSFPRLVPTAVPVGISDVRYQINISACMEFEVGFEELTKEVFG